MEQPEPETPDGTEGLLWVNVYHAIWPGFETVIVTRPPGTQGPLWSQIAIESTSSMDGNAWYCAVGTSANSHYDAADMRRVEGALNIDIDGPATPIGIRPSESLGDTPAVNRSVDSHQGAVCQRWVDNSSAHTQGRVFLEASYISVEAELSTYSYSLSETMYVPDTWSPDFNERTFSLGTIHRRTSDGYRVERSDGNGATASRDSAPLGTRLEMGGVHVFTDEQLWARAQLMAWAAAIIAGAAVGLLVTAVVRLLTREPPVGRASDVETSRTSRTSRPNGPELHRSTRRGDVAVRSARRNLLRRGSVR